MKESGGEMVGRIKEIITSQSEYNEKFDFEKIEGESQMPKREKALDCALDIRKFEIQLYWTRATYFWTFIGATFAGYFALLASDKPVRSDTLFLISCLGFMFSLSWYLVNRGSKFWQNNWERHVDMLEDEVMGPLYKTAMNMGECKIFSIYSEYPFSVSKINQILSCFIVLIWLFLAIGSLIDTFCLDIYKSILLLTHLNSQQFNVILIMVLVVLFCMNVIRNGQTNQQYCQNNDLSKLKNKKNFVIREHPLKSKKDVFF